jgi:hypothetical protein
MASVDEGRYIYRNCAGPLGEKQGYLPYPSGPSPHSTSLGHFSKMGALTPQLLVQFCYSLSHIHVLQRGVLYVYNNGVEKINNLSSFFLIFR